MSEGSAKKEEKMRKFQAIRGTRDLLPPDTLLWNYVEQTAHEVFRTFGYGEIRPPIMEQTELFARAVGGETDIVSKEMYSFEDHESNELAALKTLLVAKQPSISARNFWSYELKVAEFQERLRAAIDSGVVSKAPENLRVVDDIGHALNIIAGSREQYTKHADQEYLERFNLFVGQVRQYLMAVTLGDEVSLRPEATASVCRAYIEHNMQQLPQPVKLYYIGPMFRRERPQRGRYRQFYQIGAEILEAVRPDAAKDAAKELAKDAVVDAEVIEMLMTFFDRVGLKGTELSVNSIGHPADNCRRGYIAKLRAELTKVKDQLGADSQRRTETNPLRVLDSKLEHEQAIIAKLPHIADHLCDDCKTHYAAVKRELDLRGVKYVENWRLVRGFDYYIRTTFEITARGLGSQDAVCGGGRYDGLVELLGGPPTKGIGFAIGEDRVILSLQEQAKTEQVASGKIGCDVYVAWMGEKTYATAIRAAKTLRAAGFSVELPPAEQKFGKALERASKLGSRFALILGDDEVSTGQWTLKTLADGSQQKLTEPQLLVFLQKL